MSLIKNISCSTCGQLAQAFGFVEGVKESRCKTHTCELMEKKVTIFDVDAYYFIDSPRDAGAYEDRKAKANAGIGVLSVMEAQLDAELQEVEATLRHARATASSTIESIFEEMRSRLHSSHSELKEQMQYMLNNLKTYCSLKAERLSDSEEQLCSWSIAVPRLLRLVIADPAAAVKSALHWRKADLSVSDILDPGKRSFLCQKEVESAVQSGIAEFIEESSNFLHSLGLIEEATQLRASKSKIRDGGKLEALWRSQKGLREKAEFQYLAAIEDLEEAWKMLEEAKDESKHRVEVGKALGELLCLHSAQFSRAEHIFRESLSFLAPSSDDALLLCNNISATYFYSGRYRKAEESCKWMLGAFPSFTAENYLMMIFYWARSLRKLSRGEEAVQLIKKSEGETFPGESDKSHALRMILAAEVFSEENSLSEAEQHYLCSLPLTSLYLPASPLHSYVLSSLGVTQNKLNKADRGEQRLLEAYRLNAFHFPHSLDTARNLVDIANLYCSQKRVEDAEACRQQAAEIYAKYHCETLDAANNLNNLGNLYAKMGRLPEAEGKLMAAFRLFERCFSDSPDMARSLSSLGTVYGSMKKLKEAELAYLRAATLFSRFPKLIDTARNLNNLGAFYASQNRFMEAEQKYVEAMHLYAAYHSKSPDTVMNLINLNRVYKHLERFTDSQRIQALIDSLRAS